VLAGDSGTGIIRVGLISDTHGWLDPRAVVALQAEVPLAAILHAGDIGSDDVLYELEAIAHVTAVLGNCDYALPGFDLGEVARVTIAEKHILLIHNVAHAEPRDDDEIIVHGHSHRPRMEWADDGRLYLNPGSATQRRSQPSCSVGVLEIPPDGELSARIIHLDGFGLRVR
jgi:putative phosphoesterase